MDTSDIRQRLDAAERLFNGFAPGATNSLTHLGGDRPYVRGTTVPHLGPSWVQQDSTGLVLPSRLARQLGPDDYVRTYLTPAEYFDQPVTLRETVGYLDSVPMEYTVRWSANWMAKLEAPNADYHDVDAEFIEAFFTEPTKTRVKNLLRDRSRALVVPQALTFMMSYALRHCAAANDWTQPLPDGGDALAAATIGIPEHLDPGVVDENGLVLTDVPGDLGRDITANQAFHSRAHTLELFAAAQRVWKELPAELADHPRMLDLDAEYLDVTGVCLDDLIAVCSAFWAAAVSGQVTVNRGWFSTFRWESERLERVLDLVAATPAELKTLLDKEVELFGERWSRRAFSQFPVVRLDDDHFTVLSPHWILARPCGLWPLYDVRRVLAKAGKPGEARANRAETAVGHAFETHVLGAFQNIVGDQSRYFSEEDMKRAYPVGQVADVALEYPRAWVVAETTTTGVRAATKAGASDAAVVGDLENAVKKAEQLDATITNLRNDESKLTGRTTVPGRRFYPVLVITNAFLINPVTMTLLRQQLAAANVLQGDDVAPLEVMELDDLDITEGAVTLGGAELIALLDAKAQSPMENMEMRQYIVSTRPDLNRMPSRLEGPGKRWQDRVAQFLRHGDNDQAT